MHFIWQYRDEEYTIVVVCYFLSNLFLQRIPSGTLLECQTDWVKIRSDILPVGPDMGPKIVSEYDQQKIVNS